MTHFTSLDYQTMAHAIKLAQKGRYTTSPNPRVGCVLLNQGKIVGEGYHVRAGEGHAEVNALAQAGNKAQGATAYVTLEPCSHFGRTPPCAQALIDSGVSRVVIAMVDPNPQVSGRGIKMLEQAGISTQYGLLEQDARQLNPGFITLMTKKLPYVRCKLAASVDGITAMKTGESQWITSADARKDVQRLRAQSCAIISGAESIIADNARMTVRKEELAYESELTQSVIRQPARVVIDTKNRLTPNQALFNCDSLILLIRTTVENEHQWPHFVEQEVLPKATDSDYVDLNALLTMLAKRGLNDVLVESGATLAGAFIEQNLVDELILYQAPKLMGSDGKGLMKMPSITQLSDAKSLKFSEVTMVGNDIKITALLK